MKTIQVLRADFENESNRAVSMPIAGTVVWGTIAILSLFLTPITAIYVLLFATGTIFPLALLIAKVRRENLLSSANPLAKLMGLGILMVNLLWAVHIPLLMKDPEFIILSLGIGLGLHWVVYSWIIQHSLGILHAVLRTIGIVVVWYSFPETRIFAVASVIVAVYLVSIYQMLNRDLTN